MMTEDLETRINTLAQWMHEAKYLVLFTGAGSSTESGLRDFRGPDGVWTRRDKGLDTPKQDWLAAEPNAGHMAILDLQNMGKMAFLISQNIDNLHLKSGIRPDLLAELHGNVALLRCKRCETTYDKSGGLDKCTCGGELVSSVVNFGQSLPRKDLSDSFAHSRKCDLFIVVGSSLVVTPAAEMPRVALEAGARLVIINRGETPYDHVVHLRFWEGIAEVLPPAVARLSALRGGH